MFRATNSSMDTLPANRFWQPSCSHGTYQRVAITLPSRQLLKMGTWLPEACWATCKGEIKDNTKLTSSWFLIHTELRCTVNHSSDNYLRLQVRLWRNSDYSRRNTKRHCILNRRRRGLWVMWQVGNGRKIRAKFWWETLNCTVCNWVRCISASVSGRCC